jgi:hypothetical protein
VIGDAALARTVVVDDVTEPNPALLHETPPERLPSPLSPKAKKTRRPQRDRAVRNAKLYARCSPA